MINIYAQSFMTATRTSGARMTETPRPSPAGQRRRWLPKARPWLKMARGTAPRDL